MRLFTKILYPAALATLVLSSCGKTSKVYVQMLEPGGINLPANVKTIALVDRSLSPNPMKKHSMASYTGETLMQDREGAHQALAGLGSVLGASQKLQAKMTNAVLIGSQESGVFPAPMDTVTLNKICKEYGADAVAVLEDYAEEAVMTVSEKKVNTTVDKVVVPVTQYCAVQTATIKMGIRLYDRVNKTIDDQYFFTSSKNWTTDPFSTSKMATSSAVRSHYAINQASYNAGVTYGRRIAPNLTSVQRKFFKKGNSDMEEAGRKACEGDWNGASDLWKKIATEKKDAELAGEATFNLALASEVNGNLDQAVQLCEKAYTDYNLKTAKKYSVVLNQRLLGAQKLK